MTNRTSRRGALAALVVVGLLLASALTGGLAARSASRADTGPLTSSAESSDQHATDRSTAPAPQVVAVRPQATRATVVGQLRSLLALLAILAAAGLGLGLAAVAAGRNRLLAVPTDGIALLPPRRGPPALV